MDRFLCWQRVYEIVCLSRSTVWRMEGRGEFPRRVQLSPNRVGWPESEILKWKESRPQVGVSAVET